MPPPGRPLEQPPQVPPRTTPTGGPRRHPRGLLSQPSSLLRGAPTLDVIKLDGFKDDPPAVEPYPARLRRLVARPDADGAAPGHGRRADGTHRGSRHPRAPPLAPRRGLTGVQRRQSRHRPRLRGFPRHRPRWTRAPPLRQVPPLRRRQSVRHPRARARRGRPLRRRGSRRTTAPTRDGPSGESDKPAPASRWPCTEHLKEAARHLRRRGVTE